MQAVTAAQLEAQIPVPAVGAAAAGEIPRVAALEPYLVIRQRCAALGAVYLVQLRQIAVVIMLQPIHEQLHITACLFTAEQRLGQQLLLRRVGGKPLGQRQLAADLGRVQRIIERIVEGLLFGDAQPVNHAFQRQASPSLRG